MYKKLVQETRTKNFCKKTCVTFLWKFALASKFLIWETCKTKMSDDQNDLRLAVAQHYLASDTI